MSLLVVHMGCSWFQKGTVIEGAQDFYSSRLRNKERKKTFAEEVRSSICVLHMLMCFQDIGRSAHSEICQAEVCRPAESPPSAEKETCTCTKSKKAERTINCVAGPNSLLVITK